MERFLAWWRAEKRYIVLLKAVLMGFLPLVCCLVSCGIQGKSIGQVYLPMSEWNDELFYFKQVEGIVHYGYPQGYFGFNESHALKLSFAAWSPVLVFPWIVWGLLFGWNMMSPVICNIFLLSLAMALFVCLVRPTWKQLGVLTLLFCLYMPFVRYMLSGMPEIICFSLLILFYGLAVNDIRRERGWKLFCLFLLSGLLTLMRPYFLLFMLLPAFLWVRKRGWRGVVGSCLTVAGVFGCYAMIKHYLGAEYFAPLFFTDWIEAFLERGIGGGVIYTLSKLKSMGSAFWEHTQRGFTEGLASGAFFGGYLTMLAVLLWQSLTELRKYLAQRRAAQAGQRPEAFAMLVTELHLTFCFVGMFFALLLMYKLTEGSKHLLTFMAAGIFVISLMKTRFYKKAVVLGAVFAYLYSYKAVEPYDYQVPFWEEARYEQVETWRQELQGELALADKEAPCFDNCVIWVLNDWVEEGWRSTRWQLLYALPEGFGISCCEQSYVLEHLDTLESRYIAFPAGGSLEGLCARKGFREIYRDGDMALYQRY
ncbi:MAG: hypothetical protein NC081_01385 [Roseburia sp.]|nr:hypothetical protein [Roseburia sp.]